MVSMKHFLPMVLVLASLAAILAGCSDHKIDCTSRQGMDNCTLLKVTCKGTYRENISATGIMECDCCEDNSKITQ